MRGAYRPSYTLGRSHGFMLYLLLGLFVKDLELVFNSSLVTFSSILATFQKNRKWRNPLDSSDIWSKYHGNTHRAGILPYFFR